MAPVMAAPSGGPLRYHESHNLAPPGRRKTTVRSRWVKLTWSNRWGNMANIWCMCLRSLKHQAYMFDNMIITIYNHNLYIITRYFTTRSFQRPKNCRSSEKKRVFSRKTGFLVKNPYFGFCWICTNLSKSSGPVSNFSSLHVAISYRQLVKSVRQNARSKPKQALSDTMPAFSTGCSYLLCCELSLQRDWR